MEIARAATAGEFAEGRSIFTEYAESLGFDLCFQGFAKELETIDTLYSPPSGVLLLALEADVAAGCVAVKRIDAGTCEMRRLYVRPAHRGTGLGRRLADAAIGEALAMGFGRMTLHTLARMERARALYPALGFLETNDGEGPEGAVFMALDLGTVSLATRPADVRP